MVKAIIALLVASIISAGVYYYAVYNSESKSAEQKGAQTQDSLDAIQGANDAVQQQEDRAKDIQQKAQEQVQTPYNY